MQLRTQHKEPNKTGPVLVLILTGFGLAYGGYYRSEALERAVVGPEKAVQPENVEHVGTNSNDAEELTQTIKGLLNDN
tara:strand:+ start:101 stop:334 length:234 start_codon:yes stop_codon:yes gene_type:complete